MIDSEDFKKRGKIGYSKLCSLRRLTARPLSQASQQLLIQALMRHIGTLNIPFRQIFLFGSAARGDMTDSSDCDVLMTFDTTGELRVGKTNFYSQPFLQRPIDAIFLLKDDFLRRSKVGGICFVVAGEGRDVSEEVRSHG